MSLARELLFAFVFDDYDSALHLVAPSGDPIPVLARGSSSAAKIEATINNARRCAELKT